MPWISIKKIHLKKHYLRDLLYWIQNLLVQSNNSSMKNIETDILWKDNDSAVCAMHYHPKQSEQSEMESYQKESNELDKEYDELQKQQKQCQKELEELKKTFESANKALQEEPSNHSKQAKCLSTLKELVLCAQNEAQLNKKIEQLNKKANAFNKKRVN